MSQLRSIVRSGVLAVLAAACGSGGDGTTAPPASVATVTLNQSAATLTPQQTVTLVATTKDASGAALSGRTISWASSAAGIATVSGSGLVTAVAVGTAVITATSEGRSATATITVEAVVVPVATVTLNQSSASLVPVQTVTLVATAKDALGNTLTGRGVTWGSSASAFATVDGNGVVTAVAAGSATITATSEGKSATATITVGPGGFVGPAGGSATAFSGNATVTVPAGALSASVAITIAQVTNPLADAKLAPGTAYDFGPTGTTFTSPVTLAIKYDPATLAAGTIQAQLRLHKLVGSTWTPVAGSTVNTTTRVVTGTTSSFSIYAALEVPVPIASIVITPSPVDLPLGMQVQLTATTKDAQGNVLTGRTVTWSSSVSGTATISATTGLVTSAAIGATVITATSEGISAPMTLNVRSDPSARTLSIEQGGGVMTVPGRGFTLFVITDVSSSSCAIGADQKGYCWGFNLYGGVGDGTTLDRAAPTAIALGASLVAITVGGGFGCALDTGSNAWCWGWNALGQFGNGNTDDGSATPIRAGGGRQFKDLSAGELQVCGIDLSGGTYCWGRNDFGTLGIGLVSPPGSPIVNTPTRVAGDPGFVSISVGSWGACGLTVVGAVYCWGSLFVITPSALAATAVVGAPAFAHISVGGNHVCGLTMARQLYCWGDNSYGEVGDGTTIKRTAPVLIMSGTTFRSVAAGVLQTCAITTDNRTLCWGDAAQGVTGNGSLNGSSLPVQISGGAPPLAVVSAGTFSTCGLTADGAGYCWGLRGTLGDGDYSYSFGPTQVVGAQQAADVARGAPWGCYINTTKQVFCWAETESETSAQVPSIGVVQVKAVVSGSPGFACVILNSDSRVSCWGDNVYGELGDGTRNNATQLTPIASARAFTSIAAGNAGGMCGVSTLKELFCWGFTLSSGSVPGQILPGISWASVWGGDFGGICAISEQTTAYCGSLPSSLTLVPGAQRWVAMAAGQAYQCGLTDTGDAYCMGDNTRGQLGDGTTTNRNTMTPVTGGLKFTQIVAGQFTTCAVTTAGAAYCWGNASAGQLGVAPAVSSLTPSLVPGGLQFTKLAGSIIGFCGVTTGALVYCWGDRFGSSLGNGELDDRRTPVPMSGGKRFLLYEPGTVGIQSSQQTRASQWWRMPHRMY